MSDGSWALSDTKLNIEGIRAVRKSPGAQAWVSRVGEAIAREASAMSGLPYDFQLSPGRTRARGVVSPASGDAARDSLKNLTLLRAMGVGRRA